MNYNRRYYSRRGREFIPKPIDPGFTIDPSKVEAYKEYCLNNGLIKFPPPIPPTIDGTMEVINVHQSMDIAGSSTNQALLEDIVLNYTGKNLIDFDYVLCTISGINVSSIYVSEPIYVANVTSGFVNSANTTASGLSGYLIYQSETGETAFIIPKIPAASSKDITISPPGFQYRLHTSPTLSVVIETLVLGKLPSNQ